MLHHVADGLIGKKAVCGVMSHWGSFKDGKASVASVSFFMSL
jgi:hypothetical protein